MAEDIHMYRCVTQSKGSKYTSAWAYMGSKAGNIDNKHYTHNMYIHGIKE